MVRSSLSDIKNRALAFSQRWAYAADEYAQAKPFWLDFPEIFGLSDKRLAQFEHHVGRLGQRRGYIDLFWPGKLLVESNSLRKNPGPVNYNLFDSRPQRALSAFTQPCAGCAISLTPNAVQTRAIVSKRG